MSIYVTLTIKQATDAVVASFAAMTADPVTDDNAESDPHYVSGWAADMACAECNNDAITQVITGHATGCPSDVWPHAIPTADVIEAILRATQPGGCDITEDADIGVHED